MTNRGRLVFGIVVFISFGIIYGVHYQRQEERKFMRRGILRELQEQKRKAQ